MVPLGPSLVINLSSGNGNERLHVAAITPVSRPVGAVAAAPLREALANTGGLVTDTTVRAHIVFCRAVLDETKDDRLHKHEWPDERTNQEDTDS